MTQPSLPKRLQELAAGYVLGNLDAEELQEFQTLSEQYPDQDPFIIELQELINQFPFSLAEQHPPAVIGDRLFSSVTPPRRKQNWKTWALGLVTLAAIGLGADNLRMRYQLAQLAPQPLQIATSPNVLAANWGGIPLVLEDHIRAKSRGEQAVEIKAQKQAELFQIFQRKNLVLPAMPPNLSTEQIQFLGGAICQFDQTIGVRIMYETERKQPISFYQLHRASTPNFPMSLSDPLIINNESGPNLLLWGDEQFLFAIVADLPQRELNRLSDSLEYSSI